MNLERSAQEFHCLPVVTIYNTRVQLSIQFVHFYLFTNVKSFTDSKVHKGESLSDCR